MNTLNDRGSDAAAAQATLNSFPQLPRNDGMRPLLKWPGGKRFIANALANLLRGLRFRRYYEPFAGGAAVFFALNPREAVLADTNEDLINLYAVVRDRPDDLMRVLDSYENSNNDYYAIRERRPRASHMRAARLYYLMRLSFNGIYRENYNGDFNVPYGRKTHLDVYDEEAIEAAHEALQGVTLLTGDFRTSIATAGEDDLVYFDPPYTVKHNNNGFVKYNRKLFEWKDQQDLAQAARRLSNGGCQVIVSNADHHEVTALYDGFQHLVIPRPCVISAESKGRGVITERLMFSPNFPRKWVEMLRRLYSRVPYS